MDLKLKASGYVLAFGLFVWGFLAFTAEGSEALKTAQGEFATGYPGTAPQTGELETVSMELSQDRLSLFYVLKSRTFDLGKIKQEREKLYSEYTPFFCESEHLRKMVENDYPVVIVIKDKEPTAAVAFELQCT